VSPMKVQCPVKDINAPLNHSLGNAKITFLSSKSQKSMVSSLVHYSCGDSQRVLVTH
jgi:hypothetical protein